MRIRELIEELKKHDDTDIVTLIRRHDERHQEIFGIHYANHSHPLGGVCLHLIELAEECKLNGVDNEK